MLSAVINASTNRLIEVRDYLHLLQSVEPATQTVKPNWVAAKGLYFVHLYGAYEFTVTDASRPRCTSSGIQVDARSCHPAFLSVALDAELKSIANSGVKKQWEKRRALFRRIKSNEPLRLNDNVLPTDGSHFRATHLQCLWDTLCINEPIVPRPPLRSRIDELVDNRNAVAHGRESAATVGRRYSLPELEKRFDDIHEVCLHVLQVLDSYLNQRHFVA